MITVRPAAERGAANFGWLDAKHTFSFGEYHDAEHMGFASLRVINEDRIEPGQGFGTHPHRDMEIITYIIEGALEHKDSMGNGAVMKRGDVQHMTAGTGVMHSEFNHSNDELVHLLQIWILPGQKGLPPGYEEKTFNDDQKTNQLRLIASSDGGDNSLVVNQDISLYASILDKGVTVTHRFAAGRNGWLQVVRGTVNVNGEQLGDGDGAAIEQTELLEIEATSNAEFLFFDMASIA
jgi:redox-sensitive bicupin YhaK (pirin superfamily)